MRKKKQKAQKVQEMLKKVDLEHLNKYFDMFDRLLLYNIAVNTIPPEVIDDIIGSWTETVKWSIDSEAKYRTHFLESTPQGRHAQIMKQPDGEEIRLKYLETLNAAKAIIKMNMKQSKDNTDYGFDSNGA